MLEVIAWRKRALYRPVEVKKKDKTALLRLAKGSIKALEVVAWRKRALYRPIVKEKKEKALLRLY